MESLLDEFGICVFNETEVLIAGGRGDNYKVTNNCVLFNTNTKTFKDIANMKIKRNRHVLVNLDGVVYFIVNF